MTHHISLPHFLGESNLSLIEYKSEKFPQGLMQGPKIAIDLKPPAKDHCFGPNPPLDVGGLLAVMHGQAGGPSSRSEVKGGNGVSNRGTYL